MENAHRNIGFAMLALLACIFVGFQKTYFAAWPEHFSDISGWVHFHATATTAWAILLIAQPLLLRSGRMRAHRLLGKTSYVLFPAMLLSALPLLFFVWLRGDNLVLLSSGADCLLLLVFYVLAIWFRKKSAIHARFMIATGLVLLDPTLGRAAVLFFNLPPAWGNHLPFLTIDLALAALIFFDWKSKRNFRPYLFVLACFLVYQSAAYFLNFKTEKAIQSRPNASFPMNYAKIENAEIATHLDLWAAQPEVFRREMGADTARVEGVFVGTCQKIPFLHFNIALDLGVVKPVTESQLEAVLAYFKMKKAPKTYLHASPLSQPAELADWYVSRGMRHVSTWHRIARTNAPLQPALPVSKKYEVEEVTPANATAWADFVDEVYGMPTKTWLLELVGRPGWTQVIARDESGKIVAARSMKILADGSAYFCIDAPVPGIMTQNFEADYQLARRLLEIGMEKGAQLFAGDIEKPSALRDTPAYRFWSALGFEVAYEKKTFSF